MRGYDSDIRDVKIIEPTIFEDERCYFFDAYNAKKFEEFIGFVQIFVKQMNPFQKRYNTRPASSKRATCPVKVGESYCWRNS